MPQAGRSIETLIKAEAQRLGFPFCGVARLETPAHLDVYECWLGAGRHGAMTYLNTERGRAARKDPRMVFPEALSVVSLAFPYPAQNAQFGQDGLVAAYAHCVDYHDLIPARMQLLVENLSKRVSFPLTSRIYTDTGPILERDLAQRAGLGWIGKNTCLIRPGAGSYFFLAELFLNLPLEPDEPFEADRCGACTRCHQACPTGCIMPDRTIDARRCVSYLTIENKGPIPIELRPNVGRWLFGCDVCQQACPWNRFAGRVTIDPAFTPLPVWPLQDLAGELRLSPQEFNRKFRGSPVLRARRRGYLRNVAVVLGNLGDPAAVPDLAQTLAEEPEPLVRSHAAWALGRLGTDFGRRTLSALRRSEPDSQVAAEIQAALEPFS